jgi:hypothetical protein
MAELRRIRGSNSDLSHKQKMVSALPGLHQGQGDVQKMDGAGCRTAKRVAASLQYKPQSPLAPHEPRRMWRSHWTIRWPRRPGMGTVVHVHECTYTGEHARPRPDRVRHRDVRKWPDFTSSVRPVLQDCWFQSQNGKFETGKLRSRPEKAARCDISPSTTVGMDRRGQIRQSNLQMDATLQRYSIRTVGHG